MALGSGMRMALGAGAAGAVVVGVVVGMPLLRDVPVAEAPPSEAVAAAVPPTDSSAPDVPEQEDAVAGGAAPPLAAPEFDVVRIEPDGTGIVAGKATAGMVVAIMLDNGMVLETVADESGRFVDFLTLEASDAPRVLSLVSDPGGAAVPSDQTVVIAPTPEVEAEVAGAALTADPVAEGSAASEGTAVAEAVPEDAPAEPDAATERAVVAEEDETASETVAVAEADPGTVPEGEAEVAAMPDAEAAPEGEAVAGAVPEGESEVEAAPEVAVAEADPETAPEELAEPDVAALTETPQAPGGADVEVSSAPGTGPLVTAVTVADATPLPTPSDAAPQAADAGAATPAIAPDVTASLAPIAPPAAPVATSPPLLMVDAAGVRVLQPARAPGLTPEVLRTVALDTIAYDAEGEVQVAGRATTGGTVRLYLDNAAQGDAPVAADGTWTRVLEGVPPGLYTLRADQIADDGTVVSRIETPFLREERATIAAVMAEETATEDFNVAVRTVQPGNTLWAIARERYGEGILYVAVFEANQDLIRDPDLIYPGQIFRLPQIEE